MIWIIRLIAAIEAGFFLPGFIAGEPSPTTYAGEDLADELIMWVVAILIEIVAGVLYVVYKLV